jgi:hypothetical protein
MIRTSLCWNPSLAARSVYVRDRFVSTIDVKLISKKKGRKYMYALDNGNRSEPPLSIVHQFEASRDLPAT